MLFHRYFRHDLVIERYSDALRFHSGFSVFSNPPVIPTIAAAEASTMCIESAAGNEDEERQVFRKYGRTLGRLRDSVGSHDQCFEVGCLPKCQSLPIEDWKVERLIPLENLFESRTNIGFCFQRYKATDGDVLREGFHDATGDGTALGGLHMIWYFLKALEDGFSESCLFDGGVRHEFHGKEIVTLFDCYIVNSDNARTRLRTM